MRTKILIILIFSAALYSCGGSEKSKKEAGAADTSVSLLVSADTVERFFKEDSFPPPLNAESMLYKATLLADKGLMSMEQKETIVKYDLSSLFTQTSSRAIMGYIGDNYQRINIKFVSLTKRGNQTDTYNVVGKTRVKGNICDFKGTMKVVNARQFLENALESDTIREGFILFEYVFYESEAQKGSGIFSGVAASYYYINKSGQLLYDDLMSGADGFSNNQFVGEWKGYHAKEAKRCNWGDYRIPYSDALDKGAGEFVPADEYMKNGWEDYFNAYFSSTPDEKALEREKAEWWVK